MMTDIRVCFTQLRSAYYEIEIVNIDSRCSTLHYFKDEKEALKFYHEAVEKAKKGIELI